MELFKQRVKAQGAVVTAEMITPEMKSEYQRDYQLSSKELERMLSEMQQGYVEDFHQEENEYGRFKTNIKSEYSKEKNAGENSNIYVNEDKRSRFKEYDVKNPIIKLEQINNAAKTLLSYQLRDDGVLSYGHLTKKDFAPEALERSTKVDWDLLKRAISLVKEVS